MSGTDQVTMGRILPRIASVVASPPSSVAVTWKEGERSGRTDIVDIAPMLYAMKLYRPLRDDAALFKTAHVAAHGTAVAWGDDEAIDVSAEAIEELASQAMEVSDFRAFMKRNKLTLDSAAAHLGLSRRVVAYYAKGRAIPRVVALACAHLDTRSRAASG